MAEYLKVDLRLLRDISEALGAIEFALRRAETDARIEPDVLGTSEMINIMREFADNWRIRRARVIASVEDHQKMVTESAVVYARTDQDLARFIDSDINSGAG